MKNSIRFTLAGIFAASLLQISASAQAPAQIPTEGRAGSTQPAGFTGPTSPTSSSASKPSNTPSGGAGIRVAVRNARPSEAEGVTTPQPKRSTTSMQPNAGRPAEVNRATSTKPVAAGSTPSVKQPGGGGVPAYPQPKAEAPKTSTKPALTGRTPEIANRPSSGVAIPTEYGAQQPPQPKLR